MFRLAIFCAIIVSANARCSNDCNGQGRCNQQNQCECHRNFFGHDCSKRSCPKGRSFIDTPKGDINSDNKLDVSLVYMKDDEIMPFTELYHKDHGVARSTHQQDGVWDEAHFYSVCSGKGTCDHNTGMCQCISGYSGSACDKMDCPKGCSGHGICKSYRGNTAYKLWDSEGASQKCVCDAQWTGPACDSLLCPSGVDPVVSSGMETSSFIRIGFEAFREKTNVESYELPYGTLEFSITFTDEYGDSWVSSMIDLEYGRQSIADDETDSVTLLPLPDVHGMCSNDPKGVSFLDFGLEGNWGNGANDALKDSLGADVFFGQTAQGRANIPCSSPAIDCVSEVEIKVSPTTTVTAGDVFKRKCPMTCLACPERQPLATRIKEALSELPNRIAGGVHVHTVYGAYVTQFGTEAPKKLTFTDWAAASVRVAKDGALVHEEYITKGKSQKYTDADMLDANCRVLGAGTPVPDANDMAIAGVIKALASGTVGNTRDDDYDFERFSTECNNRATPIGFSLSDNDDVTFPPATLYEQSSNGNVFQISVADGDNTGVVYYMYPPYSRNGNSLERFPILGDDVRSKGKWMTNDDGDMLGLSIFIYFEKSTTQAEDIKIDYFYNNENSRTSVDMDMKIMSTALTSGTEIVTVKDFTAERKWDNMFGSPKDYRDPDVIPTHECSKRGLCDRETGQCQCFMGYTGRSCSVQDALAGQAA